MANAWTTFIDLIQENKRTIAKVISTNATSGKVQVLQTGEATNIYVESNGSAYADNSYVFIEGGIITGQAPNLRPFEPEAIT